MLEVRLLGRFVVQVAGQPVELPLRAAQSLLAYLMLTAGTPHRREQLAGSLWPDTPEANAKGNLRHTLWRLRKALGRRGYLLIDEITVGFDASAEYWLDAQVIARKAEAGVPADELMRMVSAYGGELLPGFYDDWIVLEREQLQAAFERKMALLMDRLVEGQRWDDVLEWGERWIALGQVPESAYRALMVAHASQGNMSNAAAVFQRCGEALLKELGVEPSAQTRALYEQLSKGERPRVLPTEVPSRERVSQGQAKRPALEQPSSTAAEAAPVAVPEPSPLDWLVSGRLIGREREMAEAKSLWQRTAMGDGRVMLISGEPGIGKTRLVRELITFADLSRATALLGECYAEGGAPYAPIAQIVQSTDRTGLEDLSGLVLADLLTLAPGLRARFPDVPPNPPLDPQAEQLRLFESVVSVCAELCDPAPLLMVIDDVHWADGGTLALVRHLARRASRLKLKLLIVLTYREVELAESRALNAMLADLDRERLAERIKLIRLDRDQTRALLAAMFAEDITPEFLDGIYHETEGNPFFVEEVCKALIEEGQLYREDGRWRRPSMSEIRVPQSVRVAIETRVGKLPEAAQETLRLCAVLGRKFDFETLQTASEQSEDTLIDLLEGAEKAQLIGEVSRAGGGTFAFTHALIPATLIEGVSGLRRRRLHKRAAQAIERLHPDDYAALAHHCAQAADDERALAFYTKAADRARKLYANDDAIRFYSEALALTPEDHPERFDLLAARAKVYDIVARREAQRADIDAMLALAEKQNDDARRCDALIGLADFYLATEPMHAREPAERAAEVARQLSDSVREGYALRRLGEVAWLRLDMVRSRALLEEAVVCFRTSNLPGETAATLHTLALAVRDLGDLPAAQKMTEEAVALSRQAGDKRQEANGLRRLAIIHGRQYRHAEALPLAEAALKMMRELGLRRGECLSLLYLGQLLLWLRRWKESESYLRQALELAEATSSFDNGACVSSLIWYHFVPCGEYETALAFAESKLAEARQAGDEFRIRDLHWTKALLLSSLGQYALALETLRAGFPLIEKTVGEATPAQALSDMSVLQADMSDWAQARASLSAAWARLEKISAPRDPVGALSSFAYVEWLEAQNAPPEEGTAALRRGLEHTQRALDLLAGSGANWLDAAGFAHLMAARLHLALNENDEALEHSTEAVRIAELVPSSWTPWKPEQRFLAHSRALRAVGRIEGANEYLRKAYERVMLVASKTQDETLRRSWLENVRDNREIVAQWKARELGR